MSSTPSTSPAAAEAWHPIATAPHDGTLIRLRSPKHPGPHVMEWNRKAKRWEGVTFAPMGSRRVCWDEDAEQPTEWQTLEP